MNILTKTLALGVVLAICANSYADGVNIIGDFTTTKTGNFVGAASALGNGDFQAESATGAQPFSNISNWFNLAGDETVNFGQSNGTNGSPQSGSLGAQLSGTTFVANDTGYMIGSAGEEFDVNMYAGQFGAASNYGLDTSITYSLFTSTTAVTGTTVVGDITVLGSETITPFNPASATFVMQPVDNLYTSVAGNIGQTVYLGISLTDTDNNVFPRIDVVSLSVEAVPEPSSLGILSLLGLGFIRRKRS